MDIKALQTVSAWDCVVAEIPEDPSDILLIASPENCLAGTSIPIWQSQDRHGCTSMLAGI